MYARREKKTNNWIWHILSNATNISGGKYFNNILDTWMVLRLNGGLCEAKKNEHKGLKSSKKLPGSLTSKNEIQLKIFRFLFISIYFVVLLRSHPSTSSWRSRRSNPPSVPRIGPATIACRPVWASDTRLTWRIRLALRSVPVARSTRSPPPGKATLGL